MIPYYPLNEDSKGHDYQITSYWEHLTAQYLGISVVAVDDLNYIDYLVYRRDAFIYQMSQTEKGQEYLDNAYRLEQTAPDKKTLRDQFGE